MSHWVLVTAEETHFLSESEARNAAKLKTRLETEILMDFMDLLNRDVLAVKLAARSI